MIYVTPNRLSSITFIVLMVGGLFGYVHANDIHHLEFPPQIVHGRDGGFRSTVEFGIYITPETTYHSSRHSRYYNKNTRAYRNYYVSPARAQIMLVQSQLFKLGYYQGPIDGIIGRGTRAGLMAFQLDNEIQPTGKINDVTLYRLGLGILIE